MGETPDKVAALMALAAVGVHSGVPRATADTDIAVLSTLDRSAVIQALRDRADVELLRGDVPDPDEGW